MLFKTGTFGVLPPPKRGVKVSRAGLHPPRYVRALSIPASICILHLGPHCGALGFAINLIYPPLDLPLDGSTSWQGFQRGSAPPNHSHPPCIQHPQIYLPQIQATITKLHLLEPSPQSLLNYPRGSELWRQGKENLWSSEDSATNSKSPC